MVEVNVRDLIDRGKKDWGAVMRISSNALGRDTDYPYYSSATYCN